MTGTLRKSARMLAFAAWSTLCLCVVPAPGRAASEAEMAELVRLLEIAAPNGGTVVAKGQGSAAGEPVILAALARGSDGRRVVTIALKSRVGLVALGDGLPGSSPGACDIVLQDTNGDGVPEAAEFECDRISAEMPRALAMLRQPLFDSAVRALIRRLATV